MDLKPPPAPDDVTEGFALLREMLALAPDTKVIVLTGQHDRENAVKAVGWAHMTSSPSPSSLNCSR